MTDTNIDLRFLAEQVQTLIGESRRVGKEVADLRTLTLQQVDYTRRVERRVSEMRDDLEIMIKMEFGGAFAHFQTVVENSLARIEGNVGQLDGRVAVLEQRP